MPLPARSDATANRVALLDAAARLLVSVGPRAPLDAIAREAGVGIATLYRNFVDRDALMAALVDRAFALVEQLAGEAEHGGTEPVEAIRTFLLRLLDHRAQLVVLLGGVGCPAGTVAGNVASITAALDTVLRRGMRDGTIRSDAAAMDLLMAGAMLTNANLPERPWQQVGERHVNLVVDGMRARTDNSPLTAPLTPEELGRAAADS